MKVFIPSNVPSSKNSNFGITTKSGKNIVLPSKQTVAYRKNTKDHWELHAPRFKRALKEFKKPYHISFKFIRKSRHKFDYVNPLQTVQDEMVKHGWIEDDNADELLPILEKYEYNKENPGVWIEIL